MPTSETRHWTAPAMALLVLVIAALLAWIAYHQGPVSYTHLTLPTILLV